MAKSFKNGASLHQLLESAPLDRLQSFLTTVEQGQMAALFATLPWANEPDTLEVPLRHQLLVLGNELQSDIAIPLDRHAQRVLTLAEGRGGEALQRVADKLRPPHTETWEAQRDGMGRSLWLYQHRADLFDEAENLFYADHYRDHGKLYEAFELDAEANVPLLWNEPMKEALEARLQQRLQLPGRCTVNHLEVTGENAQGDSIQQHLLIIRHGGPLASVAVYHETDGSRGERYFRPLHEATLLYSPEEGLVEVYSGSAGARREVASAFAEVALKIDLSRKPLTLKHYRFDRFLTSLDLPLPTLPGFDIERAAVVEVIVRTDNPKHRTAFKVTIEDHFEQEAIRVYGPGHLFRHATCIAKIIIAVRFTSKKDNYRTSRTLNITLSDPNRCNLRSHKDPMMRELGYALLTHWDIMTAVRMLDAKDEAALFPALLELYDQGHAEVPGQFFQQRGLDLEALANGGFIERRGRFATLRVEVGDSEQEVSVRSAGKPGWLVYDDPADGLLVEIPAAVMDKYSIRRDWLTEAIIKRLKIHSARMGVTRLDDDLTAFGDLQLREERIPCYLARGLVNPTILQRLDVQLRAQSARGVGLVLAAGREHPLCLGPNIIASLPDLLSPDGSDGVLDMDRLASVFTQGKQLARGGMVVDLVKQSQYSATLYLPGKPPLALTGAKMIDFFQALLDAYQAGSPAVPTKQLMGAADSSSASPRQLFGQKLWDSIEGVYVGFPPGVKRGYYQLLV